MKLGHYVCDLWAKQIGTKRDINMIKLWNELLTEAEQRYFAQFPAGAPVIIKRGDTWERGTSRGTFHGMLEVHTGSSQTLVSNPELILPDPTELL